MKRIFYYNLIFIITLGLFAPVLYFGDLEAANITPGNIYLQVEQNGEAWYVHPISEERFYLGRPDDAWNLLRGEGVGISNANLKKIPLGLLDFEIIDTDKDGLSDNLENSLGTNRLLKDSDSDGFNDRSEIENGYNPLGAGAMPIDINFSKRFLGYIFLQVEAHGEAWYVNPSDAKRYYLGQKEDAFAIMRSLGVGIKDVDLHKINLSKTSEEKIIAETPTKIETEIVNGVDLRQLEFLTMELVNHERLKAGLKALTWNKDLASVAREHSRNLTNENKPFTGFNKACDFPIIHHEGLDFGPYNSDRIKARGVYYYDKAGENIALVSAGNFTVAFLEGDPAQTELENCSNVRTSQDLSYENRLEQTEDFEAKTNIIKNDLKARENLYNNYSEVEVAETYWYSGLDLAEDSVLGWMESPGHKANILSPDYDEAGIGAAYVNGYVIVTQSFIKRAFCGYLNGPCCSEPGYLPYCYLPMTCNSNNICQEYTTSL
jgi:uncharacterized protein YkwD